MSILTPEEVQNFPDLHLSNEDLQNRTIFRNFLELVAVEANGFERFGTHYAQWLESFDEGFLPLYADRPGQGNTSQPGQYMSFSFDARRATQKTLTLIADLAFRLCAAQHLDTIEVRLEGNLFLDVKLVLDGTSMATLVYPGAQVSLNPENPDLRLTAPLEQVVAILAKLSA